MNQYFKKGAYILIALSVLASCMTGVLRIQAEQDYKDLQVAVRYTDIIDAAQQKDQPIEKILGDLKDKGATTILVRENTLLPNTSSDIGNWKAQGKLTSYEGYELIRMYPEIHNIDQLIQAELNYIWVTDKDLQGDIVEKVKGQNLGGKEIVLDGQDYIEYRGTSNTMSTAGMGFPKEELKIAADMGYVISPQAKAILGSEEGYVKQFTEDIKSLPNLGVIYFADADIPGIDKDRKLDPAIIELAQKNQIGFIEFFSSKQKGLYSLVKKASEGGGNYKVVRLHTASDGEFAKLTPEEINSRFWLAATERNQQVLLYKMRNTEDIKEDFDMLGAGIERFVGQAEAKGYRISPHVKSYNLPTGKFILAFLSGLGAIALFALFLDLLGQRKAGIILGILGTIGYAGILKLVPTLGLQLMALFGASIYPAYAVLWALEKKPKNLKETVKLFLQICLISFGGALTIVGLLSRTSFGLTIDLFAGVKLAHLMPIALVILAYIYKKYDASVEFVKKAATSEVTYVALAVMAFVGLIFMIYTSRTGNSGSVSSLELAFRSELDRLLGVRPRTKEFMIGYPLMLILFYYGKQEKLLPLLAISIIGPISLVNTYAHLHTPVIISLIRSAYGIIFGLMIGIFFINLINQVIEVVKKWQLKNE